MGDINVRVNCANNPDTITLLDTFNNFGLKNYANFFNRPITENNGSNYQSAYVIPHIPDLTRITAFRSQHNTLQTADTRQNHQSKGNLLQKTKNTENNQHKTH